MSGERGYEGIVIFSLFGLALIIFVCLIDLC